MYKKLQLLTLVSILMASIFAIDVSAADAKSLPVLVYHGVTDKEHPTEVSKIEFARQMEALRKAGYRTITTEQARAFLQDSKKLPAKSILITFDDGRKDSFYNGDPILKKNKFKATMFVIGKKPSTTGDFYLTQSELHKLQDTGRWELQAHSYDSHKRLAINKQGTTKRPVLTNRIWLKDKNRLETLSEYQKRVRNDLSKSKSTLEDNYDADVIAFAYPFGAYGQGASNVKNAQSFILKETKSRYDLAFYQAWNDGFRQNVPGKDTFLVKRIAVDEDWSGTQLIRAIEAR